MRRLVPLLPVLIIGLAIPASAEMWKYRDQWGMTHIVESLEKVPPEFRDKAEKTGGSRGGIQTVKPLIPAAPAAKPAGGPGGKPGPKAAPAAQAGVPFSFNMARLRCDDQGNENVGSWIESRYEFRGDPYYVLVAATWCPHCIDLFETVQKSPKLRQKISGVLVYEDEAKSLAESRGRNTPGFGEQRLSYPAELSKFSLPFFLIRRGTFPKQVSGFPTLLECRPEGCKKINREQFVAENQ